MATIVENAHQYASRKCNCAECKLSCKEEWRMKIDGSCDRYKGYVRLYVDVATEQWKIDIEKACEVYHKELSEIVSILNKVGKELYDIYELGEIISIKGSIKDFMKRMEDKQ